VKWEYCTASDTYSLKAKYLNSLGAQGWELVSVTAEGGNVHAYFKRPIELSDAKGRTPE
jgi:hypothetical protein